MVRLAANSKRKAQLEGRNCVVNPLTVLTWPKGETGPTLRYPDWYEQEERPVEGNWARSKANTGRLCGGSEWGPPLEFTVHCEATRTQRHRHLNTPNPGHALSTPIYSGRWYQELPSKAGIAPYNLLKLHFYSNTPSLGQTLHHYKQPTNYKQFHFL